MKRIIVFAAALLTLTGVCVATATAGSASVCQPNGSGCTAAGTYAGPNAVINGDYDGDFSVVWTESIVQPYASGVPVSWTAYATYTNISSSSQTLDCTSASSAPGNTAEHMSGGSGDDGTVSASSTQCSENPDFTVSVPPGGTQADWATFSNVPWPGSAVSLSWGDIGTSPSVYPFGSASPPAPTPPPSSPPTPVPPPAPAQCPVPFSHSVNGNWSGWGTCAPREYTGITGDFQVPTVTGKTGWVVIWDGLGGTPCNQGLEQAGVSAEIVKGRAVYKAWWEVVYYKFDTSSRCFNDMTQAASKPHFFSQTVKPGDRIQVSVTYSSSPAATSGTYWLYLKDVTRGWSENVPVAASGHNGITSRESAECIVEDVGAGPLPDFKTVYPGNVRIYPSPNLDYGWTQQGPVEYALTGGKVSVARISGAGDFSVTWKQS
jgi:hypothetical protein